MTNKLKWFFDHFEECVAGFGLVVMSLLVFAQVVMRYAFHAPMSWSDEIAVYCMLWSVYLSASWAVRERAHIRVMNLINVFPKKIALWLTYFSDFVWFIFAVFIFWQGILLDASLWERSYQSPVLGIEQKWPYMVIAAGFGLMVIRLIQVYYRWIKYDEPLIPEIDSDSEYHA